MALRAGVDRETIGKNPLQVQTEHFNIFSEPVNLSESLFLMLHSQWLGSREESHSCPEHGSAWRSETKYHPVM
jgi:hypothetical protein